MKIVLFGRKLRCRSLYLPIYKTTKIWYYLLIDYSIIFIYKEVSPMYTFRKLFSLLLVLALTAGIFCGISVPAAASAPQLPDPYIYCFAPSADRIPSYYAFYARHAVCNSPHYVVPHGETQRQEATYLFNIVNLSELIWDEAEAPEGGYATINGFCADRNTGINSNSLYRKLNLEDAYFCFTDSGWDPTPAEGIRAVMHHTWPYVEKIEQIVDQANDYLLERYGEDAVLIQDLTGAELLSASQAAVWHYSNNDDFSSPYPYSHTEDFDSWGPNFCQFYYAQMMYLDGFVNIREKQSPTTASNINGIYDYLINLPGESVEDQMITENALNLAGAMQTSEEAVLLVSIDGTVNADDNLTLTATYTDRSEDWNLGSTMEAEALSDNLYAVRMDAADLRFGGQLTLTLAGDQTVQDICFLEAKPADGFTPRDTSQNVVAYSNDRCPVGARKTMDMPNSRTLVMVKEDAASGNPLPGVAFDLYAKLDGKDVKLNTLITDAEGKISVDVMDDGTEYYFVEAEVLPGYESEKTPVTGGTVSNTMSTGTLTVSKKLINTSDAKPHEQFNFRLTLDFSTAPVSQNNLPWLTGEYLSEMVESTQKLNWTVDANNILTAEFTLKADASITLSQLPLGTTYRLEEILTPQDRLVYTVTTQIGDGAEQKSVTAQGTVAEQNAVLYTNTLYPEANPQTGDALLSATLLLMALLSAVLLLRRKPQ